MIYDYEEKVLMSTSCSFDFPTRKGYVTECLNYAKDIAVRKNCYKMLLTASKE